jgi:hypothetical protein
VTLALSLCLVGGAYGQTVPDGDAGRLRVSAGVAGSGIYLQYGVRTMGGLTGFVDLDARSPLGVELEGRWVELNQRANVHTETYSVGPRYHHSFGNLQAYGKGMVGFGDFNFPYDLARGRFVVVTAGGGVDLEVRRRLSVRAVDVEYQCWPQFTYGTMSSFVVSAGLRVRVF